MLPNIKKLIVLADAARHDETLIPNHISGGVPRRLREEKQTILEVLEALKGRKDEEVFMAEMRHDLEEITEALWVYDVYDDE